MAGMRGAAPVHGWLKLLEEGYTGAWAWQLRHFELTESSLTWTAGGDSSGIVGFVSLFDVLSARCGPRGSGAGAAASAASGVAHDITLVTSDRRILRMRAPTPAHAGRWIAAVRAAVSSTTGAAPPPTCKEEDAKRGIDAAAVTADDSAHFPGDASELSPLAMPRSTPSAAVSSCRCSSSLAAKSSPSMRASPRGGAAGASSAEPTIDISDGEGAAAAAAMSAAAPRRPPQYIDPAIVVGAQTPAAPAARTPPYSTAASAAARRDLRPTHERYSYAPALTTATQRLSTDRAARPVVQRLYDESLARQTASQAQRSLEALDLQSFDYAVKAGLEDDGVRGERATSHKAISEVHEERQARDCTFAPNVARQWQGPDGDAVAFPEWDAAAGPVWDRLHLMANEQREKKSRTSQVAQYRAVAKSGSFTPQISQKAQTIKREGPVEDRLISGWAERLVAFEERVAEGRAEELAKEALLLKNPKMSQVDIEAKSAQLHADAARQRAERLAHAQREQEARALEDVQRTAGARPVSSAEGERLYQKALEKQRQQVLEKEKQERVQRSPHAIAIEEKACDRLYQRAQEHRRKQREREMATAEPTFATPSQTPTPFTPSPTNAPNSSTSSKSPGSLTKQKSVTRAEAEESGAQMYYKAMVRAQQKEQAALQAKREQEALDTQLMRRTAVARRGSSAYTEQLYHNAVKNQQRHEQLAVERQKQLEQAEIEGATFKPKVSKLAKQMSSDASVEQRTMAWHQAKQAKQAEAAASATGVGSPSSVGRRKSSGDPAYFGGKARTVDSF